MRKYENGEEKKVDEVYRMVGMTGDRLWAAGFYEAALKAPTSGEYVKSLQGQFPWLKGKKKTLVGVWNFVHGLAPA